KATIFAVVSCRFAASPGSSNLAYRLTYTIAPQGGYQAMRIPRALKQTVVVGLALAALLFATVGGAQQRVPFRNNIPVAPQGIPARPLPDKPVEFQTAEGQDIRVVVVTKGLSHPWGLAFLPDGSLLVTERAGKVRLIRDSVLDPNAIPGVPKVFAQQLSGLMDVALHPRFSENKLVYLTYTKPLEKGVTTALARGRWDGHALVDVRDIFVADSVDDGRAAASRIVFAPDGNLFMTVGGTFDQRAQDPMSHGGKVLRLRDDGTAPPDNPFVGQAGYKAEIFASQFAGTRASSRDRSGLGEREWSQWRR